VKKVHPRTFGFVCRAAKNPSAALGEAGRESTSRHPFISVTVPVEEGTPPDRFTLQSGVAELLDQFPLCHR
jgi:hypothetical protein